MQPHEVPKDVEVGNVTADGKWCDLRGVRVPVEECATSCPAPEHKIVCWLATPPTERDEDAESS